MAVLGEISISGTLIKADELADFFINRCLVAVSRGDGFGSGGGQFVRMNIGCPRKILERALEQIREQYEKIWREERS